MRRTLALLIVGCLLLGTTTAFAAPREKPEAPGRGRAPAPLGGFALTEDHPATAQGVHISFNYTDGGILDYRTSERSLFDVFVSARDGDRRFADRDDDGDDEDEAADGARARGAMLRVRMPNFTFTAHDNPTAVSKLVARSSEIVFEPDVKLHRGNGDSVRFAYGNVTGVMRGDHLVVNGTRVAAAGEVLFLLDKPRGDFDKHHRDIGTAIAKRHVGAEATFNYADDALEQDVVSYGNVTMSTIRAERGNLTVLIDGHGFDGRVIVLNVDGRMIGAASRDDLHIILDNASVAQATNITDILDPDDDGYTPEYYIVHDPLADPNAYQLIVTLPHYSVHTLSVTLLELVRPSVAIGVLAGIALLVPAALVLFRRKA